MQGIADIFLSFFYFPGPAYPQYLLRPFCRPPTASSGAAVANRELDLLTEEQADAILKACKEILEGKHHDQFPVDMIQGGAGTTTNMNANEVIANRALELMGHHQLDSLDEQILRLIASNARIPFLEVARACNVSGAAIHQRIQKLTNLGILKGSEYVIDPEKIGYETCAYIGLYLKDPEQFDSVTEALKNIPEVVECHFTTGQYDMFIKIYAKNNHHLLSIIHDKLQPLGLARSETINLHQLNRG